MGIKFQSPIDLSAHRAIRYNSAAQNLIVTVATKTAAHPEYGNGSTDGYVVDGIEGPYLEFTPGNTYKFDQSDNSNTNHPLRFYEDAAKTTAYTTGVTTNGVPGQSGAYTQIVPTTSVPPILYYQCSSHSLMGSYVKFGTGSQGDTYTLSASQDGNNVDILLDAGTGTDSTVQLTAGSNVTLTRNSAQEVTIASSGGGGGSGTVSIEKNVYTGNGSTTTFNTSSAIANENNVQVYIDGVYQSKDNYTTSGSTVTMATAPGNGTSVELIQFVTLSGNIVAVDTFNANGVTTTFNLTLSISDKNNTQVYIDGVYQDKSTYSVNGNNITFSPAPGNGAKVEVVQLKPSTSSTGINSNVFTGDGNTVDFTLSQSLTDENNTFVFIQGVYQEKSTYSLAGTTLTFSTPPQNGYSIEVMAFDSITIGNQVSGGTDWQSTVQTSNFTAVAGKGYFVDTSSNTVTVTLPTGSTGDEIHFTDYASTFDTNEIIFAQASGQKIIGDTANYKCNTENAVVKLIYQDNTKGWTADNIATTALVINFLVVAGGGGAGRNDSYYGGGGGGGGFRSSTDGRGGGQSSDTAITATAATNYTVTVGGGGAEGTSGSSKGTTGSDSVFATITSKGGGGAGAYDAYGDGLDGGSGGGAGGNDQDNYGGHALTSPVVHGYDGGDETGNGNSIAGAGGGGAGSVGADSTSVNGATGGAAKLAAITGSNVYYAAGGGGKRGWNGSYGSAGANATGNANSGDGGGGNDTALGASAAGRSGVVILKYASNITLTIGAGLTSSTATVGSNKVTTFTAGTGNVQFS